MKTDGVQMLEIDQCEYSSRPTRLMTNLSLAAVVLARCCERGCRHAQLPGNDVAVLADNHLALSLAFLDALRVELSELQALSSIEKETHRDEDDLHEPAGECYTNHLDELTGCPLDPHLVMRGRERELKKLEERAVYERVPCAVAMQDPEGKFVRTRWDEVQKGKGSQMPICRPRIRCWRSANRPFCWNPSAFRSSSSGVHGRHLSPTSMGTHGS